MPDWKRTSAAIGAAALLSATGYAVYFDYRRRNNAEFRKQLRHKAVKQKKLAQQDAARAKKERLTSVQAFLQAELAADPISTAVSEMESTFTANVELGKAVRGPGNEMVAAAKFYKALAVYPNPADLLGIYQRTIPEAIYEYIVLMIAVLPPTNITSFINTEAAGAGAEEPLISERNVQELQEPTD
ncbi:Tom20 family protein KNAG_0A07470 [Huiozyma naganishii CBS 8797]|uniref:Mitochondrial import receptor subunit TOM20 n=1 Tax=Huiozyma naganishii (strain ATCC MYA-139 / BCRC 22969 / CBS 8797 / KCTC 17520 / NBRC 10181 / NCYC 3082 / Yp74L-3) TaxID=1071383 RepID=J7R0Q9_HUIN7|nr:hypothetical protein KNAG_0A07470 [Kazachstania naganishii CBS 8797]CCK68400.1 hypothetical protein KNAG_0A07470 [Kazachstania naganishii CBS 8797]